MTLGAAMHRTSQEANGPAIGPSASQLEWIHKAEVASQHMLDAMDREFMALARQRGILFSDARLFLMNAELPHGR